MGKIKTIYVTDRAQEVFNNLEDIRPKNISFSELLSITAKEFIKNHDPNNMRLEDFCENKSLIPSIQADISVWKDYIKKSDLNKLNELQSRLVQLDNLISMKQDVMLR